MSRDLMRGTRESIAHWNCRGVPSVWLRPSHGEVACVGSVVANPNCPWIHNKVLLRIHYFDITILRMNKQNDSRHNPHIFQWKSFIFTKNRSNIKFINFTLWRKTMDRHCWRSLRSDVKSINLLISGNPQGLWTWSPVGPNILSNLLYCDQGVVDGGVTLTVLFRPSSIMYNWLLLLSCWRKMCVNVTCIDVYLLALCVHLRSFVCVWMCFYSSFLYTV